MAVPQWLQDHVLSISLVLFSFVSLVLLLHKDKSKFRHKHLPPSPPRLPIIGNLHQLGRQLHRSFHALSQKYGPIMLLQLGGTPTLIISSPEMAKEIVTTHDLIFADRPITKAARIFFRGRDVAFSPYGEYWRQVRMICVIDLFTAKRVRSFKFVREEEIANTVSQISKAYEMENPVNLTKLLSALTNNVITRVTLGRKSEGELWGALTQEVLTLLSTFSVEDMFPGFGWIDSVTGLNRKIKSTFVKFQEFLDEVIEQHMSRKRDEDEDDDTKDFVDILLECQKNASLGISLSKDDLKSIILDMFVAGTNSTYTILEWAMAELIKHPQVMRKVQEEIRQVVGKNKMVDENEINQMSYLNCVVKETLRLYSSTTLPRVSSKSVEIGPYFVPAKTTVMIHTWSISRDPKHWDRPDEFIPDRFIHKPNGYTGANFEFIPFGVGRRGCPAMTFGVTSVETILANLLYLFDWKLPNGVNKEDLVDNFDFTVRLKEPLYLIPLSPSFLVT